MRLLAVLCAFSLATPVFAEPVSSPSIFLPNGGLAALSADVAPGSTVEWLCEGKVVATSTADAAGKATANLQCPPQGDRESTSCGFALRSNGQETSITASRVAWAVSTNSEGVPVTGIVADGQSVLMMGIYAHPQAVLDLPEVAMGRFLKLTEDGELVPLSEKTIAFDEKGQLALAYQPPAELNVPLTPPLKPGDAGFEALRHDLYSYLLPLSMSVRANDVELQMTQSFTLHRPSVILVPDFQGERTTKVLEEGLKEQGFRIVHYDSQELSNVPLTWRERSDFLGKIIEHELSILDQVGVLAKKVDVVAYGQGGLVARAFTQRAEIDQRINAVVDNNQVVQETEVPVRKVILLATPNHGLSTRGANARVNPEYWPSLHPNQASGTQILPFEDLQGGSSFLRFLNADEATGKHLKEGVQYAQLIAHRRDVSQYLRFADDDGMVQVPSAHLSGVYEEMIEAHHAALQNETRGFISTQAIVDVPAVASRVATLLQSPLARQPLENLTMKLTSAEGQLYFGYLGDQSPVTEIPQSLNFFDVLETDRSAKGQVEISVQNQAVAKLDLAAETKLQVTYASPELVMVRLHQGTMRITGISENVRFLVELPESSATFYPRLRARTLAAQGELTVEIKDDVTVYSNNAPSIVTGLSSNVPGVGLPVDAIRLAPGEAIRWGATGFGLPAPGQSIAFNPAAQNPLANIQAVDAQSGLLCAYTARLGLEDHINQKGSTLKKAASILQRDRVNVQAGRKDLEDEADTCLVTADARKMLGQMADVAISPTLHEKIVNGTPLVRVELYADHLIVTEIEKAPEPVAQPEEKTEGKNSQKLKKKGKKKVKK